MKGFLIVNRIYYKPKVESIILTEFSEQKENNRMVVKSVYDGMELVSPGDVVIVETMADYEVVYSDNNQEHRLIRIKEEDIIAIDNGFEINETMRIGV